MTSNIAVSFADPRLTAIYFDHVIALNAFFYDFRRFWINKITDDEVAKIFKNGRVEKEKFSELIGKFDQQFADKFGNDNPVFNLLPPELRTNTPAFQKIFGVNGLLFRNYIDSDPDSPFSKVEPIKNFVRSTLQEYGLEKLPVDVPGAEFKEFHFDSPEDDPLLAITDVEIVNVSNLEWGQIAELRKDEAARSKLFRFRTFARENFHGDSVAAIEDQLHTLLEDHNQTVREWGLQTRLGVYEQVLNSKTMASGGIGSFISVLLGGPPLVSVSALAAAGAIEVGKISLYLSKRKSDFSDLLSNSPVAYLSVVDSLDDRS